MPNFTKLAIQQSFLRLLSQRPITKITVKDIVEDCGINRNSFYYHFQDLPQLLETVIIESADEIISRIPESFSLEEGLTTVLERLVENKRAIRNIWASPDRAFYEQNLMRVCNYVSAAILPAARWTCCAPCRRRSWRFLWIFASASCSVR